MVVRSTGLAAALSVVVLGWCAPALAQSSLRESAPAVAKYVADDREFILDRTGPNALLKFHDSPEVWALRPSPGPRGDVIYRDDLGRPVVRATRLGGMTVFTPDRPGGLPAALSGEAAKLRPAIVTALQLFRHLRRQSGKVSKALGRGIAFEAPDVEPGQEQVYADAATVTAEALTQAAPRISTHRRLAGVNRVRFVTGARPDAGVSGDAIEVVVTPSQGVAGRPSSRRLLREIGAN